MSRCDQTLLGVETHPEGIRWRRQGASGSSEPLLDLLVELFKSIYTVFRVVKDLLDDPKKSIQFSN